MRPVAMFLSALLLGACAGDLPDVPEPLPPGVPAALDAEHLSNAYYSLSDAGVRSELTRAGQSFVVRLRGGSYRFPASALVSRYGLITLDAANIRYGDLNADGIPEALAPLLIGEPEDAVLELAALSASGSQPFHFASFPLGKAVLKSLAVTNGKIRVNFTHSVPGDPGPRNTELTLELPEGAYR